MTRTSQNQVAPQYVVAARMGDAVGNALRDAYRGSGGMPDEFVQLLDKLDARVRR
ncbi:hypothetical protein [Sphingomonas sp.]|uniref:hypothetical protein n=1 Tax=Sphingomonas sp. TaxID=28214 RepID=UPI002DD69EA7|nr:hypothetical protein [Sphingomonas sp.]